jgi:hypothetical protein
MIPRKYHKIVFSFFMALFMSGLMSFAISIFNVGMVHIALDTDHPLRSKLIAPCD